MNLITERWSFRDGVEVRAIDWSESYQLLKQYSAGKIKDLSSLCHGRSGRGASRGAGLGPGGIKEPIFRTLDTLAEKKEKVGNTKELLSQL